MQLLQSDVPQAVLDGLHLGGTNSFALPQRLPEPGGVDDGVQRAVVR